MRARSRTWHLATAALLALGAACTNPASTKTGGSGGSSGSGGSGGRFSETPNGGGGTAATGGTGGGMSPTGGSSGSGGAPGSGGSLGGGVGGITGSAGNSGAGGKPSSGGTSGQSSSADAGVSADAGADTAGISGLKIEANPKNVLSCFVTWKTTTAATSAVQFGVSKYEWEISDTAQVTDHKVVVIGMRASQTYLIKAISTSGGVTASGEGKFTTAALPSSIPVATISAVDATKMQAGWTLMNIQKGDGTASARSNTPAQAVMYDAEGQPVWYYIDGTTVDRGGAVPTEVTDKGVLIGATLDNNGANAQPPREVDFAGNTLWECATPSCSGTGNITHHATKLPNGHTIVNRDVTVGNVTAPVFEEIDANNKVVWSMDYRKMVPPPSSATGDWCHGNSVTINMDKNEVYANCRFVGLIKTTYQNPSLVWHLPASYGGAGLGNVKFSPTTSQFSDTHDPEIHDDGTVLFFDNGGYDGVVGEDSNPKGYHSRAVEYKIDEAAKTATLVWEFPGTFTVDTWYKTKFYLPFWGDADRLANGNVLITAGVRFTAIQSRVFEVTKQDGKVVWEFQLPLGYGVYRAQRLSPPPLVHAIP